ncbi:MAG: DsbA family protein [Caldilineaceae bacterium]
MVDPAIAAESDAAELAVGGAAAGAPDPSLLQITYYTDPLCSWSWAFEPQWRRLRYELGDQLHWSYRMGGMIPDWQRFNDPLNDVSRPVQMGPLWYQVRTFSGMPINERIWFTDAPASSYPACIAVKAAEQQGPAAGEHYLRQLRAAVMVEGRNIARLDVQQAVAHELAATQSGFDAKQFVQDLESPAVLEGLREDLKDVRWREIGRFPTLILRNHTAQAILIVGYRPYDALLAAVRQLAPAVTLSASIDIISYIRHWGQLTTREIAEVTQETPQATESMLAERATAGELQRQPIPPTDQSLWSLPQT